MATLRSARPNDQQYGHVDADTLDACAPTVKDGAAYNANHVWDTNTLAWVKMTAASAGSAVSVADGADVAQGTTTDVAWTSGSGTVIALLKKIASAGGSAVSIADGADANQGTTTDAAVVTDVAGTMAGKLRGLVKMLASVWDSGNGRLKVDGSAVTQPVSGPLTDAQLRATAVPVSFAASTNPTASGNLTTNGQSVSLALLDAKGVGIMVLGTWTGTISFEASANGTNWGAYEFYNPITSVELAFSSTTVNGFFQLVNSIGITHVRAIASAAMTGIAAVSITGTQTTNKVDMHIKENGSAIPSYGVMVAGTDGTLLRYMRTAADGTVRTDPTGTTTQPVSGTFWQATQPVSIASMPSTPVTGPLTDAQLRATAVPVSGTFWQATQPVSGPATDAQLRATPLPVSQPAATDWRSDLRRGQTILKAVINASASGDNTLVAADATKKIKVLQYTLIAASAVNVTFKSAATAITGAMPFAANGGAASPFVAPAQGELIESAVSQALILNLSGAVQVSGHLTYILEA